MKRIWLLMVAFCTIVFVYGQSEKHYIGTRYFLLYFKTKKRFFYDSFNGIYLIKVQFSDNSVYTEKWIKRYKTHILKNIL